MSSIAFRILRTYSWFLAMLLMSPLAIIMIVSLTNDGSIRFPPQNFGFRWILTAFTERSFVQAFTFSVVIAAIVSMTATLLAMSTAVALTRFEFGGKGFVQAYVMAPLLLPHLVIAIGLIQLFSVLKWTTSPEGLIAGHVVCVFPLVLRLCLVSLAETDPMAEKAAYSLGASRFYVFRRITIPQVASAAVSGSLIAFLLSFDESVIAIFTSTPGRTTLPVMIFNYVEQRSDPLIAAVSSIMIGFAIILIILADRSVGVLQLLSGGQIGARGEPSGN